MIPDSPSADAAALVRGALQEVLLPIARLCVGKGIPFVQVEELLKRAFVDAAREQLSPEVRAGHRDVSRVSTATGISRREVTRLSLEPGSKALQRTSPATQTFTRWLSDARLRSADGRPRALPRQGPAPSFEALAHSVTRDVHPRSLLDELLRLGLVQLRDEGETVELVRDRFVPGDDQARLFRFLGANAGDHLAAAVANVLSGRREHFEQAIFSDGVSAESARALRDLVGKHWSQVLVELVPAIEAMIESDRNAARPLDHRLRVGLYSYEERLPPMEDHEQK